MIINLISLPGQDPNPYCKNLIFFLQLFSCTHTFKHEREHSCFKCLLSTVNQIDRDFPNFHIFYLHKSMITE